MAEHDALTRRTFLGTAASAAAVTIVPRHVLGGPRFVPPSDRITVAYVGCGSQQPGCECQAVAQLHRAAVDGEIGEVLRHSPGHVGERARRARDVHERAKVGTCLDREAQERRLAQRLAQSLDEIAERAGIVRRGDHRSTP